MFQFFVKVEKKYKSIEFTKSTFFKKQILKKKIIQLTCSILSILGRDKRTNFRQEENIFWTEAVFCTKFDVSEMIFLYGNLHIFWRARNVKICEHSIFLIIYIPYLMRHWKFVFFIDISWGCLKNLIALVVYLIVN